ncbi:hypothetical protein [Mesoplasma coleopterae]|nr:hypothetical protein [Mesoplasma coleopterae]
MHKKRSFVFWLIFRNYQDHLVAKLHIDEYFKVCPELEKTNNNLNNIFKP